MSDQKNSLEKQKLAEEQVSEELAKEAVDAYRQSRVCLACPPKQRAECHTEGQTPASLGCSN